LKPKCFGCLYYEKKETENGVKSVCKKGEKLFSTKCEKFTPVEKTLDYYFGWSNNVLQA
jgi:hypothetical protein